MAPNEMTGPYLESIRTPGYRQMQAQDAAMALAESRGDQVGAEHLRRPARRRR